MKCSILRPLETGEFALHLQLTMPLNLFYRRDVVIAFLPVECGRLLAIVFAYRSLLGSSSPIYLRSQKMTPMLN